MAPPLLRTARKSTSDTLVNDSPTTSPKSTSWLKGFQIPRPKRSMSDGDSLAGSFKSSPSTLPPSPLIDKALLRRGTVDSLGSDLSDEKQPISPLSPQWASSPPTSAGAQTSPGSPSSSPQRLWKRIATSVSAKQGVVIDHAPSTAMVVAKALVTFGEASNIPYLKGVAGLGLLILETAEGVTSNKDDCLRLKAHVQDVIMALDKWRQRLGEQLDPSQKECLEQTQSTFQRVHNCIKKLANPERGYTSRFLRQNEDAQNILQCEKDLQHAFRLFSVCD